ncbi:Thioredoxin family protein [Prunus dulcis]|uniref:Thioredoxin family protein n=1 Tax=Prunus dulcis TaxID=3755 RepID=A0A4Y1RTH2_PRUDU|nr:Thioredoxin family protein [Prunus dulcis]
MIQSSETPVSSASVQAKPEPSSPPLTFAPPPNFKPPEPKRFGVRPDKVFDILGASLALLFRLGTGALGLNSISYSILLSFVSKDDIPADQYALEFNDSKVKETSKVGPRPQKPIEIYEFEGEIVAVLDLDVLFYPCPKNGPNFRRKVAEMGGKQQFPYMVDPNTGVSMYESDDIIKYLVGKYGTLTAGLAMIGRSGKGSSYSPSRLPPKPLVVWAYEGSPFCKIVREVLVELELPHIYRSCARGSPKRQILFDKTGRFQEKT